MDRLVEGCLSGRRIPTTPPTLIAPLLDFLTPPSQHSISALVHKKREESQLLGDLSVHGALVWWCWLTAWLASIITLVTQSSSSNLLWTYVYTEILIYGAAGWRILIDLSCSSQESIDFLYVDAIWASALLFFSFVSYVFWFSRWFIWRAMSFMFIDNTAVYIMLQYTHL